MPKRWVIDAVLGKGIDCLVLGPADACERGRQVLGLTEPTAAILPPEITPPNPLLRELAVKEGEVEVSVETAEMFAGFAEVLREMFVAHGGTNYVGFEGLDSKTGEVFRMTIQRKSGMTPEEKAGRLADLLERAKPILNAMLPGTGSHCLDAGEIRDLLRDADAILDPKAP
ncbi:MAG: hypothetical protein ACO1SV_21570 [Fimbriimonas sp.]